MKKHSPQELRQRRLQESLGIDAPLEPVFEEKQSRSDVWFYSILSGFVLLFLLFYSLFVPFRVSGDSMANSLQDGQWIVLNRNETVNRFDIVVANERLETDGPIKPIVKRVIGMPGDVVTVLNGQLYINEKLYEEDYLSEANVTQFKASAFTIKVPENHVFLLGDNRDISADSRTFGCFELSSIVGVKLGK